jgi:hypothetical protein
MSKIMLCTEINYTIQPEQSDLAKLYERLGFQLAREILT